ncbi:hypothetical protein ANCCEY_03226 [Ancylostoma ceylanicum]|uniref:Coiled-coil domain-containing protein 86 n=1 Tax=Ancylostoma ceylanicum TaxID=53326 RepID=A0A0D6MBG6_9BILA|nr:hypothetical protein ANCCEY_03226 [Ancylostoma ceylanicum]
MMEVDSSEPTSATENAENPSEKVVEIRGMPKSGRWWKEPHAARSILVAQKHLIHSAVIKVKPLKSSWEKKMADKAKQKQAQLIQQEIRERKQQEKLEKIERKKEQEKRRLENERKGEVVQVIKNTAKLRKAKKKQLRLIEKRDTN